MTIDDGYPSDELPLKRQLEDGRTVAEWIRSAQIRAASSAEYLRVARETGRRRDLTTAERNLERALSELRTIRYAL